MLVGGGEILDALLKKTWHGFSDGFCWWFNQIEDLMACHLMIFFYHGWYKDQRAEFWDRLEEHLHQAISHGHGPLWVLFTITLVEPLLKTDNGYTLCLFNIAMEKWHIYL